MARTAGRLGSVWKLIRYRRLQALTIALLAALVTTCAVFAPLYDRATQQALVDVKLAQAPIQLSGLALSSAKPEGNNFSGASEQLVPVQDPKDLVALVPASVRSHFARPVVSISGQPDRPGSPNSSGGALLWRAGFCRHVVLLGGRCPTGAGEIAVSRADAHNFGYKPGTKITIAGAQVENSPAPTAPVTVVGVYRQRAAPYWFGLHLTGSSGLMAPPSSVIQHDYWLTDRATFYSRQIPRLPQQYPAVDFTLDQQGNGVDELLRLAPQLRRLERKAQSLTSQGIPVSTDTGLTEIADLVSHQRAQSEVTIPLLMVQLGLLAVVVLWLVLGAATEQRRPEVALALLRGRGRRGARRLLLRELLPVALAGVPGGLGVALLLCWATVTFYLPGSASIEIRPAPVLAVVAAVLVLVALAMLAVRRVTREPVETLLRRVPTRGSGWRLGALETLVIAAAGTAVVAFVTGGLTGPIALAAPALLALVVGLLLA
ncbi:MAG: FtsX-like permease family protein, partial [Marmoricola sp.]